MAFCFWFRVLPSVRTSLECDITMMPTPTTAASDPGRGSARDPLLFLLAFFLLAYGESTVLASLNRSAGRLLCPTRRAGDENGVRRWSDDDGNVCRNWISGMARPEPAEHVVSPLVVAVAVGLVVAVG